MSLVGVVGASGERTIPHGRLATMPRANVSPSASATATTQPHQAGMRKVQQDLANTLSRIVNTLREATAASINPRVDPATAAMLSQQNLALQTQANQISTQLDALTPGSDAHLAIYQDLNTLGDQVQAYVRAVANALQGIGGGLQTAGSVRLGALTPDEAKAKSDRMWIIIGVTGATLLAGIGLYIVARKNSGSSGVGKIKGAISAR